MISKFNWFLIHQIFSFSRNSFFPIRHALKIMQLSLCGKYRVDYEKSITANIDHYLPERLFTI